jgi:ubiquitin-protein ligase
MSIPRDPRQDRLRTEHERLEKLNRESDYIHVQPIDVLSGSAPEHYRVTFKCRGIVGINSSREPVYGDEHVVEMHCNEDFPADVPRLRWVTPIWHPNIQHKEPKGVCVNKSEWLGGTGLDDLCRQMFEMVQYKNYHALPVKPYPMDVEVAQWVLEHAEPRGIVDKKRNVFVDDRPFVRPSHVGRLPLRSRRPGRPDRSSGSSSKLHRNRNRNRNLNCNRSPVPAASAS